MDEEKERQKEIEEKLVPRPFSKLLCTIFIS